MGALWEALEGGPSTSTTAVWIRVGLLTLLAVGAAFGGAAIGKHWSHFSNDDHTRDVIEAYLNAHLVVNATGGNALLAGENLITVNSSGASISINGTDALSIHNANGTGVQVDLNYHGGDGVVVTNTKSDDYYSAILLRDPPVELHRWVRRPWPRHRRASRLPPDDWRGEHVLEVGRRG